MKYFMYSGFILFSVLNTSRARVLSRFTSIVDLPDLFKITGKAVVKYSKSSFLYFFYLFY